MEKGIESGVDAPLIIPTYRLVVDQERITTDVLAHPYEGQGTDSDPYVVTWITDDPGNPMTFATSHKWAICMLHAFATLIVALDSSAFSGMFAIELGFGPLHLLI